jgi:hypothetical protein
LAQRQEALRHNSRNLRRRRSGGRHQKGVPQTHLLAGLGERPAAPVALLEQIEAQVHFRTTAQHGVAPASG